jgi:anti-sigma28 factor (negative regulator of flagellin synthesis)
MAVRGPNGFDSSSEVREAKSRGTSGVKTPAPGAARAEVLEPSAADVVVSPSVRANTAVHSQDEDVRAERLQKLQRAIDDGSYVADRGRLADRFIDEEFARKGA